MTEFYVIMQKRLDDNVYVDLHKTNQHIYLSYEDALDDYSREDHYKNYCHIVKLVASLAT